MGRRNSKLATYSFLLSITFIANITILLDIPLIKPIFAFIYYSFFPGYLLLKIICKTKLSLWHTLILSLGSSLTCLIFFGLFFNTCLPFLKIWDPLSTTNLVFSFTLVNLVMICYLYYQNFYFNITERITFEKIKSTWFYCAKNPLLYFPIFFPLLVICGLDVMRIYHSNLILLFSLLIIIIYVIFSIIYENKTSFSYPFTILMIGISLLLFTGMTSYFFIGRDIYGEFFAFKEVSTNLYWSMKSYSNILTATLSTSLLPTIYFSFMGIEEKYIFKFVFQLICGFLPVFCYLTFKPILGNFKSYIASLFFMFQVTFIYGLFGAIRTEISFVFFSLCIFVLINNDISKNCKRLFLILFMSSMIVCHYTTAYIFILILSIAYIVLFVGKNRFNFEFQLDSTDIILLLIFWAFYYFWYCLITGTHFFNLVSFVDTVVETTFIHTNADVSEVVFHKAITGKSIVDFNQKEDIPRFAMLIIYYLSFILIFLGVITSLFNLFIERTTIRKSNNWILLLTFGCICCIFLTLYLVVPYLSSAYGSSRLFQQMLVILAPFYVIGVYLFIDRINKKYIKVSLLIILIFMQFFAGTYLLHQFFGVSYSANLNFDGDKFGELYVFGGEFVSAEWLLHHSENPIISYDSPSKKIFSISNQLSKRNVQMTRSNSLEYIYLRYYNLIDNKISTIHLDKKTNCGDSANKIYNNMLSQIMLK